MLLYYKEWVIMPRDFKQIEQEIKILALEYAKAYPLDVARMKVELNVDINKGQAKLNYTPYN
jgi:hypothetical protein